MIIQAAERLITGQGASALTVRGIAAEADMNPSLVRYYYDTTEDLLIAFFRELADRHCRKIDEALGEKRPLQALWDLQTKAPSGLMTMEIMSLGHRFEGLRHQLALHVDAVRTKATEFFREKCAGSMENAGVDSPEGVAFIFLAVTAALVADRGLGITTGNAEVIKRVDAWIAGLEGD